MQLALRAGTGPIRSAGRAKEDILARQRSREQQPPPATTLPHATALAGRAAAGRAVAYVVGASIRTFWLSATTRGGPRNCQSMARQDSAETGGLK